MRGTPLTDQQKTQIISLYRAGKSCRAISEVTGIGHTAVYNAVSQEGITRLRTSKPAERKFYATGVPTITSETQVIIHKTVFPDYAPVCAASMRGSYKGTELEYRR